jgi:hypothetical protein
VLFHTNRFPSLHTKKKCRYAGFAGCYPLKEAKKKRKDPLNADEKPDERVFCCSHFTWQEGRTNLQTCKPASTSQRKDTSMPRKKRNQNPTRAFTYADIVAFFERSWGKIQDPTYTLEKITLLLDIAQGGWHLACKATYLDGTTSRFKLIVIQIPSCDGTFYLNHPTEEDLPPGLESIEEENAAIERQQAAEMAEWRKKWEAEREQSNVHHRISSPL